MMTRKLRPVLFALVGTLSLSACGGDEVSQDTDASSSSGGEETIGSTLTDPDSSSTAPATESGETTMADSSGGSCVITPQLFADPSFENGMSSPWGQASSLFPTPLCDASCNGVPASEGSWYVWLGGSTEMTDVAGVAQDVTINAGDAATLTLDVWYGSAGTGDIFQILVDGDVLFEVDATNAPDYAEWTEVSFDVSAYADGTAHDFDFTGSMGPGGNFYLDNVRLETCADGSAATAGDTVDAPVTGGTTDPTDTESDTDTGPLKMCDEDLGSTVPQVVMGNNSGAGNDTSGSCLIDMGQEPGEDVAYSFTAPTAGIYTLDTLGSEIGDTVLYVFEDCMGGPEIACSEDIAGNNYLSQLTLSLAENQTIAIVVDGWSSQQSGSFVLNIRQIACDTPTDLGSELPIEIDDDNTGAGDDVTSSCGGGGSEDVVYDWTPPQDGIYAIYAVSLQMAPVVSAFSGACGEPADELGCDAGPNFAAINAPLAADQPISIVVDAANGSVGSYELDIDLIAMPSGDCCAQDDSPGCEDIGITQCACAIEASCCASDWPLYCAGIANSECSAGCPLMPGGTCCDVMAKGEAGCDVPAIEACVCSIDDFCCTNTWDDVCVDIGATYCLSDCA